VSDGVRQRRVATPVAAVHHRRMTARLAPRFLWVQRTCEVAAHHRVLEVGCGHGIALGLFAERASHVLGIDRSPAMVDAAARRNAAAIAAGRIEVRASALCDLPTHAGAFDLIVAINVRAFAAPPYHEIACLRALLAPAGRVWLYHDGPSRSAALAFRDAVVPALRGCGFTVREGEGDGNGVLVTAHRLAVERDLEQPGLSDGHAPSPPRTRESTAR
jgi:SAM-dependent methyltransferase